MPDYASILRRSISALPDSSPEMREAVYQRARAALARQLTAVDPPLSSREIENQHRELEDAVAQLEADYAPAEPDISDDVESVERRDDAYGGREVALRQAAPGDTGLSDEYDEARDRETEGDEEDEFEDEEGSSRIPLLAGLILLVLVVGGAATYAFAERERLFAFLDFSESAGETAAVNPAAAPPGQELAAVTSDAGKRPDRLTNGAEGAPTPEPPAAALVEPEPPLSLPADEGAPPEPAPPEPAPPEPAVAEPAPPVGAEQQTAALQPPSESIVEQRAIYYFQGAEGTPGQATPGHVTWAQTSRESGPAVQAELRLADRDVVATVTIYKNGDPSLPASHLVEVQFSGPLGTSPVQRVPALVVKQTEQARGQPLSGAAVPVTNELFWIALSDDQEQVARNLQLLREGSWFDIPILFEDGTRALLTFEKGVPGGRVFETAMSSWTSG